MTELPFMPMFWRDFLADTGHVSGDAAKAYLFLIGHAWLRGGKLENNDVSLALMARCGAKQWRALKPAVMSFWTMGQDGFWHQKRLSVEFEKAIGKVKTLRENGRKGGLAGPRDDDIPAPSPSPRNVKTKSIHFSGKEIGGKNPNDINETPLANASILLKHPHLDLDLEKKEQKPCARADEAGGATAPAGADASAAANVVCLPATPDPSVADLPPTRRAQLDALTERLFDAGGAGVDPTSPGLHQVGIVEGWIADGADLETDVLVVIRALAAKVVMAKGRPVRTWLYFRDAVFDAVAARRKGLSDGTRTLPPPPTVETDDEKWGRSMQLHHDGKWSSWWGPPPGENGCSIPIEFQRRWQVERAQAA